MKPNKTYKFCPLCKGNLKLKKENLLVCQECGYEFYINPLPCNAAIIENEKGEILLVKRKFDPKKGFWDLPGGFIDAGEEFETSVKREIKEELDVEINVGKIIGVYSDTYVYQKIALPSICITVSCQITGGEINPSDDISGYQFFSKEEVVKQDFAFPMIERALLDYLKGQK